MSKISISEKTLDPLFERLEKLTKVQRLLIFIMSVVVLAGAFIWFSYLPKHESIKELRAESEQLQKDLAVATEKAQKLETLRKELAKAEARLNEVRKALPEKEEIPSLLASISGSGQDAGLEFHLFQPNPEVRKEFYAEIPVAITVEGTYHNMGAFFDMVSNLSRIVNIQDVKIQPSAGVSGDKLMTSCTAVTYKFLEEEATKTGPKTP